MTIYQILYYMINLSILMDLRNRVYLFEFNTLLIYGLLLRHSYHRVWRYRILLGIRLRSRIIRIVLLYPDEVFQVNVIYSTH